MKTRTKIILAIIAAVLIAVGYFGYGIYKLVSGSEDITGAQTQIPEVSISVDSVQNGTSDWPCWRGPNLDGKSSFTGLKTDWSAGLKKLWQADYLCQDKATASWSAPVVAGNRLIVPGRDEKNDLVFCLNAETGKLIWKGTYSAEAGTSHGPGARATPFIDSNRVYTFGRSGDLVCWNFFNGEIIWKKNVKDIGGTEPQWGFSSSPFVYNDMVVVQGGGSARVIAYNKFNGEVKWKSGKGESGYSFASKIILDSKEYLLIFHGTGLACLNPDDGAELWSTPWETDYFVNATTPVVSGDSVFITSGYGMGGELLRASKNGVKVLWKNDAMASQHSDLVKIGNYIYGYSGESTQNKGHFKCIEFSSGKEIWSTGEIGWGTFAFADGHAICMDLKANVYLVNLIPGKFHKAGEMLKVFPDIKNFAWTSPVIANGKLYLRNMQSLICFDLRK